MKVAVIQHELRAHERMDLAALLASAEDASDEGAGVIVCPRIPGLAADARSHHAFIENMRRHAPGSLVIIPSPVREESGGVPTLLHTPLGRTVTLVGDECIAPEMMDSVLELGADAMVWQPEAESALQAEAMLEVALDASLSIAGLVLVTSVAGRARGISAFGTSAVVQLGEILAEGDGGDVVTARLEVPVALPDRPGPRPVLPPILAQRLAHHRGTKAPVDWPADLS